MYTWPSVRTAVGSSRSVSVPLLPAERTLEEISSISHQLPDRCGHGLGLFGVQTTPIIAVALAARAAGASAATVHTASGTTTHGR